MKEKGIILLAIGEIHYGYFAFNMAMSIKYHSPNMPIQLICEPKTVSTLSDWEMSFFDIITEIDVSNCYQEVLERGRMKTKLFPAGAKLRLNKYMAFNESIYLDVDGLVIKPIEPLFDECSSFYHTQVIGTGTNDVEKFDNMVWAYPKDIWSHYGLKDGLRFPFIQSSFQYLKKGDDLDRLYAQALENLENPIPVTKLRYPWGKSQPDELYMNIALAQLGLLPSMTNDPVYFTNRTVLKEPELLKDYYLLGLFGIRRQHSSSGLLDYYDRLVHKYMKSKHNQNGKYKAFILMRNKFVQLNM